MRPSSRVFFWNLAILGGFAVLASSVQGSTFGFHEFLKQGHTQSLNLPRLYEPAPSNVPHLSNGSLIRLWQNNQFSPILRDPGIQMQLCEAVTERRNLNPV